MNSGSVPIGWALLTQVGLPVCTPKSIPDIFRVTGVVVVLLKRGCFVIKYVHCLYLVEQGTETTQITLLRRTPVSST